MQKIVRKLEPEAVVELFPDKEMLIKDNEVGFNVDGGFIALSSTEKALVDAKVKEYKSQEKLDQQKLDFSLAIEKKIDTQAQELRYDNMMSARSYTGYENPFQAEAQKLSVWASNCWVVAGQIEADVQGGVRDMPTIDEVLSELPIYE